MIQPSLTSDFQNYEYFGAAVDFEWDEWKVRKYFYWAKESELEILRRLTPAARIALAIGAAEWVLRRFDRITDTDLATEYLESCWMATVDLNYGQFIPFQWPDWRGPLKAPQLIACGIASTAIYERNEEPDPAWAACYGFNLVRHVLPAAAPFEAWLTTSFVRAETHHSLISEALENDVLSLKFEDGSTVGRSIFEPSTSYSAESAANEMREFVAERAESNQFSASLS